MDLWRVEYEGGVRPAVMSGANMVRALVLHVLLFAFFFFYACVKGLFDRTPEEPIQFIDPTVVVNENLDGVENEPPPLQDPTEPPPPPPPPPKPKPVEKKVEPSKELEKIVTNIVKKVEKKEEKKEEKAEKKEPEKPKEPQKTKEQLRKERIEQMRKSAKTVKGKTVTIKVNAPSGNGRTDRKTLTDAEIMKKLNEGYRPGKSTVLAKSDEDLAYSLIRIAFDEKWENLPCPDTLKPMTIRVWFGAGGRVLRYQLESSSGDARVDQAFKSTASRVGSIPRLPEAFIDKYRSEGVRIRYTVRPR